MTKTVKISLPDGLEDDLKAWADLEGSTPSTIALRLVVAGIYEAKVRGIIPLSNKELQTSRLLWQFIRSGWLNDQELAILAHDGELLLNELHKLRQCLQEIYGTENKPTNKV